jgi:hypothetical protein
MSMFLRNRRTARLLPRIFYTPVEMLPAIILRFMGV